MIRLILLFSVLIVPTSRAEEGGLYAGFKRGLNSIQQGFSLAFKDFPAFPFPRRPTPKPAEAPIDPYDIEVEVPEVETEEPSGSEMGAAAIIGGGAIAAGMIGEHLLEEQSFADFCHATSPHIPKALRKGRVIGRRMARRVFRPRRIPFRPSAGPVAIASVGAEIAVAGNAEQYHRLAIEYAECYRTGEPPEQGLGISNAFLIDLNQRGIVYDPEKVRNRCAYLYKNLTGYNISGANEENLRRLAIWHQWNHKAYTEHGPLVWGLHSLAWPRPQMGPAPSSSLSQPLNGYWNSPMVGVGGF